MKLNCLRKNEAFILSYFRGAVTEEQRNFLIEYSIRKITMNSVV